MKKKAIAILMLTALVLGGCGSSKPNEKLDDFTNELVLNPEGNMQNPTKAPEKEEVGLPDSGQADASDGGQAAASQNTSSGDTAAQGTPEKENTEDNAVEEEKYYLSFEATTTEGEAWNSDQLSNSKMTMINVWATYCNPCLSEMPDLGELAAEYDVSEFQIVGVVSDVMADAGADDIAYARELITETKADYPHLLLNESLYMSFVGAVSAVPTTFFVRQDGSLIGYLTGAQSKEGWKMLIDQLLAELQ